MRCIILDWDGTLYNSLEAVLKTYSLISGRPVEEIRKLYTPNWKKFIKEANIPKFSDAEWRRIFVEQSVDSQSFSGAKEYLLKIRDGHKLAVATAADFKRLMNDLTKTKLSNFFDAYVTLEDAREIKPNPKCLEIAVKKLSSEIKNCLYVGDAKEDALAAKAIGMKFIGVSWGFHKPDLIKSVNNDPVANNFNELYDLTNI